jgi:hypothetical protein
MPTSAFLMDAKLPVAKGRLGPIPGFGWVQMRNLIAATFLLSACSPHPAVPDEPWFNIQQGNTWTPDAAVISNMKENLDRSLRPILERKVDQTRPRSHYWFQFRAYGSGRDRAVAITGGPFPVPPHADVTFYGAFIPESCHVVARYLPEERRIEDLGVGGFDCPPRLQ